MTTLLRARYIALVIATLVLVACGGGGDDTEAAGGADATDGDTAASPAASPQDGGGESLAGQEVEVLGGFQQTDAERFQESIAAFEEQTGADVVFVGSQEFASLIVTRAEAGDPPDVALFPQPGLMQDLAADGFLQPLDDIIDVAALDESVIPGLLEASSADGQLYGVPYRLAVKSLVWYPSPEFSEAGYEIPETWEDFLALTEQIRGDGNTPLCLGIESGGASGWPVTDWIEELMLRTAGPEAYDAWVNGELEFSSPEVTRAAEMFAEIAFTEGNVLGGRQGMVSTSFDDSVLPMFEDPPACYLHRQGNFIAAFFPEDAALGEDVNLFYFPPELDTGYDGRPVLGGGDIASLLTDNPAAEEFMRFLATPEAGESWAAAGGYLSPHQTIDTSIYPDDVTREIANILAEADVFRFDASDLMPGAVGTGSFWTEMISWINGDTTLEDALAAIDASWPESS